VSHGFSLRKENIEVVLEAAERGEQGKMSRVETVAELGEWDE